MTPYYSALNGFKEKLPVIRDYVHFGLLFPWKYLPATSLFSPLRKVRWLFITVGSRYKGQRGSGIRPRSHRLSLVDPSPEACHLPPGPGFFLLP